MHVLGLLRGVDAAVRDNAMAIPPLRVGVFALWSFLHAEMVAKDDRSKQSVDMEFEQGQCGNESDTDSLTIHRTDIQSFVKNRVRGGRMSPIRVLLLGMLGTSVDDPLPDWMEVDRLPHVDSCDVDTWLSSSSGQ